MAIGPLVGTSDGKVYVGLAYHGGSGHLVDYDSRTDRVHDVGDLNTLTGDSRTGRTVWQMTDTPGRTTVAQYATQTMTTPDGRWLIYGSDSSQRANFIRGEEALPAPRWGEYGTSQRRG